MTPTEKHPSTTGPDYEDAEGWQALYIVCPDCGQGEWWTQDECQDHGKCRASTSPCPVCEVQE